MQGRREGLEGQIIEKKRRENNRLGVLPDSAVLPLEGTAMRSKGIKTADEKWVVQQRVHGAGQRLAVRAVG